MESDTRECPFCGETIKAQAKKCRFCGEFLEANATREDILAGGEAQVPVDAVQATSGKASPETAPSAQAVSPVEAEAKLQRAVAEMQAAAQAKAAALVQQATAKMQEEAASGDAVAQLEEIAAQVQAVAKVQEAVAQLQEAADQADKAPPAEVAPKEVAPKEVAPSMKVEVQVETQPAAESPAEHARQEQPPSDPLKALYERIEALPDSEEKKIVKERLAGLWAQEEMNEDKAEIIVKTVIEVLPDVAEITINTLLNPASGVTTLVQKVAQRMAKSRQDKKAKEEQAPVQREDRAAEPEQVDKKEAVKALNELRDDLNNMPDSKEKQLVEQTLEQLEVAQTTGEAKGSGSTVGDVVGSLVEALPKAAEAATEIVHKIAETHGQKP